MSGTAWQPPAQSGDFAETAAKQANLTGAAIAGYTDGFVLTAPVGSFAAATSWCGSRDLAGNVPYDVKADRDTTGLAESARHMVRGGPCLSAERTDVRISLRDNHNHCDRNADLGFRIARNADADADAFAKS